MIIITKCTPILFFVVHMIALSLTLMEVSAQQQLISSGTVSQVLLFGTKLQNALLMKFSSKSLKVCIRKCQTRKRCKAISYYPRMKFCELHFKLRTDADVVTNVMAGSVYTEIHNWVTVGTKCIRRHGDIKAKLNQQIHTNLWLKQGKG